MMPSWISDVLALAAIIIAVLSYLHSRKLSRPQIAFDVKHVKSQFYKSMPGSSSFQLFIRNNGNRIISIEPPLSCTITRRFGAKISNVSPILFNWEEGHKMDEDIMPDKQLALEVQQSEITKSIRGLSGKYYIRFHLKDSFSRPLKTNRLRIKFNSDGIDVVD